MSQPTYDPKQRVKVMENSGNRGSHSVVGTQTRIQYGRHSHGEVFEMHPWDQAAQQHLYILQTQYQPVPTVVPAAPAPAPVAVPVAQKRPSVVKEEPEPEDDEAESEDQSSSEGLDLALFTLPQIQNLIVDADNARVALPIERAGRNRKTVIRYLQGLIDENEAKEAQIAQAASGEPEPETDEDAFSDAVDDYEELLDDEPDDDDMDEELSDEDEDEDE